MDYLAERERRIEENKRFLESLGLKKVIPAQDHLQKSTNPRKRHKADDDYQPKRRSARIQGSRVNYTENGLEWVSNKKMKANAASARDGLGRKSNPGRRVVSGRIYDSERGSTCHQCRQKVDTSISPTYYVC